MLVGSGMCIFSSTNITVIHKVNGHTVTTQRHLSWTLHTHTKLLRKSPRTDSGYRIASSVVESRYSDTRVPHPLPQAGMKCLLTDQIDMDRGVRVNESLAGRTLASGLVSHAAYVLMHMTVCTS